MQTFGWLLVLVSGPIVPAGAQATLMPMSDSLTPAKRQLRDYVVELQDTLALTESLHARIARAQASGMISVVLSSGHQLQKACRAGTAMAETTKQRIVMMRTSDPHGDQALASFRSGLTGLADDLRFCQHDDSLTMAVAAPDQVRIREISATASDAIVKYNEVRDGLLQLLEIQLPVHGYIPHQIH